MVRRTSLVTSGIGMSAMSDTNSGVTNFAALNVAVGQKWVAWSAGILTGGGVTVIADYEQQDTTVPLTLTGGAIGDMAVMMIAHNGAGISSTPTALPWEPLLSQATAGGGSDRHDRSDDHHRIGRLGAGLCAVGRGAERGANHRRRRPDALQRLHGLRAGIHHRLAGQPCGVLEGRQRGCYGPLQACLDARPNHYPGARGRRRRHYHIPDDPLFGTE
jgi:hypothetical protein